MQTISSPYNFVPLNKHVLTPSWWDKVSHDLPFSDGEDGYITMRIINVTPLYTRDGTDDTQRDSNLSPYSAHVVINGAKRYFLPATSLKGMLRAVSEVLTFSAMKQYNDSFFGYRSFDRDPKRRGTYANEMKKVECGWLQMKEDSRGSDPEYEMLVVPGDVNDKRVFIAFLPSKRATFMPYKEKVLVCSGNMKGKLNEHLFDKPEDCMEEVLEVSREVIDEMRSVYKPSPQKTNEWIDRLIKGREIEPGYRALPVFFIRSSDGKVAHIGLSRNFRLAYKHRVSDAVKQDNPTGMDMTECIFGTADTDALRGRVQVCHAFAEQNISDSSIINVSGVLGQPQASYYPLYVKQTGTGEYKNYNDTDVEIAGRKRYRIHHNDCITKIPAGNGNEKVKSELRLLPAGCSFTFRINVHNLRPVELGALLSALTFHRTSGCYHNIGMGKSFGYGKLHINDVQLTGFKKSEHDYLKEFELYMSSFTIDKHNCMWTETEQVKLLLGIATDHTDNIALMDLKGYKDGKDPEKSVRPKENVVEVNAMVRSIEIKKQKLSPLYREAESLRADHKFDEAIKVYWKIAKELAPDVDPEIKDTCNAIMHEQEELLAKETENSRLQEEQRKQARLDAGLAPILEEKYNNKDEYKVKDFKGTMDRTKQYIKKKNVQALTYASDLDALCRTLLRVRRQKDKFWADFDSREWKKVCECTSDDWAKALWEEINKDKQQ